jgi:hypothetical protein
MYLKGSWGGCLPLINLHLYSPFPIASDFYKKRRKRMKKIKFDIQKVL